MMNDPCEMFMRRAVAAAQVRGSDKYPDIHGEVRFYPQADSVLVRAEITELPQNDSPCENPIFAFHIHGGQACTGTAADPFADAGMHLNPNDCPHPYHAGDMPPLFGVNGRALLIFATNRFRIPQIIGKTVIIHARPDDFVTQPSGNAGEKIACGVIEWAALQ